MGVYRNEMLLCSHNREAHTRTLMLYKTYTHYDAIVPVGTISNGDSCHTISQSDDLHSLNNAEYSSNTSFPEIVSFRKSNHKRLIFSHLNLNSLRNKFCELQSILADVYVFGTSETKLDASFSNAQFMFDGFSLYRVDIKTHGGGIVCYANSDRPHRITYDCSHNENGIESIAIQLKFSNESVFKIIMYRPPTVHIHHLNTALECIMDKCLCESSSIYIIGDLNVNVLNHPNPLDDSLDILNLINVVQRNTCFKNVDNLTLLDVMLTNTPRRLTSVLNMSQFDMCRNQNDCVNLTRQEGILLIDPINI